MLATSSSKVAQKPDEKTLYVSPKKVEAAVKAYFKDIPLMADIAQCESHYHQYASNGNIYRGSINTSDVGVMQINEKYHLQTSKKMGLDIYTLKGNMAYARYLYTSQGSEPWISSSACWDNVAKSAASSSVAINK